MTLMDECRALSDDELEGALRFLAERERHGTAKLLAHLAEYDRRQLCVSRGHSGLFHYCLHTLGYDEGGSFRRIRAARVARRWPVVLEWIEAGELHLTALVVLSPVLKDENGIALLRTAKGKTRRQLEAILAESLPRAPQADFARRLPVCGGWSVAVTSPVEAVEALPAQPTPPSEGPLDFAAPPGDETSRPSSVPAAGRERPWEWQAMVPISADRVRIGFDAALAVMRLIDRARQILRHKYPDGRLEDVVKEALELLLDRKDPQRRLGLKAPAPGPAAAAPPAGGAVVPLSGEPRFLRSLRTGRYIPARVKAAVWRRDDGRCAWRFEDGTPCGSRDGLEYDHVRPFSRGGRSDTPRNVRLLCRLHNRLAAERAGLSPGPRPAPAGLSAGGGGGA